MFRRLKRKLGYKCHVFESTDRYGCNRRCIHCGEEQMEYVWWVTGPRTTWWETSRFGDGSCDEKPLPVRIC